MSEHYDPALPVWTSWDLGIDAWDLGLDDVTAMWFAQVTTDGEFCVDDYIEPESWRRRHPS